MLIKQNECIISVLAMVLCEERDLPPWLEEGYVLPIKSKLGQIRPHCSHIYSARPAVPRSLYHSAEPQKTCSLTSIKKKPWFVQRQITIKTSRKFPFSFFPQAISIYVLAMVAIPFDDTIFFFSSFYVVIVVLIKHVFKKDLIKIRCLNISAFFP